jgi:hypothetical protein
MARRQDLRKGEDRHGRQWTCNQGGPTAPQPTYVGYDAADKEGQATKGHCSEARLETAKPLMTLVNQWQRGDSADLPTPGREASEVWVGG